MEGMRDQDTYQGTTEIIQVRKSEDFKKQWQQKNREVSGSEGSVRLQYDGVNWEIRSEQS